MGTKQRLIGTLIFLAVFALAYFMVWGVVVQAYESYKLLEQERANLDDVEWLVDSEEKLSKEFTDFRQTNNIIFSSSQEVFSEADFLIGLSTIVKNSGLELTEIDIKEPDKGGIITIQGSIKGRFESYKEFLKVLERSLPFFDFMGTQLQVQKDQANQEFPFEVRAYIIPLTSSESADSYTKRRAAVEAALKTNADIVKDDRLKQFKPAAPLPVKPPTPDMLGGKDPFAPL